MSNYSYSEIQSMQKKAMERVREMQRNSDAIVESAQQTLDIPYKPIVEDKKNTTAIKPKVTNMPPNFPDFNEYFRNAGKEEFKNENKVVEKTNLKKDSNILDNILSDPDRLLILGLLLLLKSEGNDEMLMMALMYIMA